MHCPGTGAAKLPEHQPTITISLDHFNIITQINKTQCCWIQGNEGLQLAIKLQLPTFVLLL